MALVTWARTYADAVSGGDTDYKMLTAGWSFYWFLSQFSLVPGKAGCLPMHTVSKGFFCVGTDIKWNSSDLHSSAFAFLRKIIQKKKEENSFPVMVFQWNLQRVFSPTCVHCYRPPSFQGF